MSENLKAVTFSPALHSSYFGAHLGQQFEVRGMRGVLVLYGVNWKYVSNINNDNTFLLSMSTLLLKPISAITDEDAIEVSRINQSLEPLNLVGMGKEKEMRFVRNNIHFLIDRRTTADYLRSQGYALPWREYSVEQLIEAGVLKLIES